MQRLYLEFKWNHKQLGTDKRKNIIRLFTFRVQLHVDNVSHHRSVVEILNGVLCRLYGAEKNFCDSQMLFVLGIVQNFHLLYVTEFLAHVG